MADYRIPDSFGLADDPVPSNPYRPDDPRHRVWADATRKAEERVARIGAEARAKLTPETATTWLQDMVAAKFDAWAERGITVIWSDEAVTLFDRWLVSYANSWLNTVLHFWASDPPPFATEPLLTYLRNALGSRVQFWKAEARRSRAEQEARAVSVPQRNARPAGVEGDRRSVVTAYLAEASAHLGRTATRTDFWKWAGYKSRTEFERWQRRDPRATQAAARAFERVLRDKPYLK